MFPKPSIIVGVVIGAAAASSVAVIATHESAPATQDVEAMDSTPTPLPAPTKRPAPTPRPPIPTPTQAPLVFDHSDPEVVSLWQESLNDAGFSLVVDGVYGANTEAATLAVQRDLRVPQTGRIDEPTVLALYDYFASQAAKPQPTATPVPVTSCNYDPCLPPASDYDCAGGSGDGPAYTGPVRVIGWDRYDLDRDGDGLGCEWS